VAAALGQACWSTSVVHHLLSDPVDTGTAYFNRYDDGPAPGPRSGLPACKPIPVPAILDEATAELARTQLARNALLSFRCNQKYRYLAPAGAALLQMQR
jgi:hypothetical protein